MRDYVLYRGKGGKDKQTAAGESSVAGGSKGRAQAGGGENTQSGGGKRRKTADVVDVEGLKRTMKEKDAVIAAEILKMGQDIATASRLVTLFDEDGTMNDSLVPPDVLAAQQKRFVELNYPLLTMVQYGDGDNALVVGYQSDPLGVVVLTSNGIGEIKFDDVKPIIFGPLLEAVDILQQRSDAEKEEIRAAEKARRDYEAKMDAIRRDQQLQTTAVREVEMELQRRRVEIRRRMFEAFNQKLVQEKAAQAALLTMAYNGRLSRLKRDVEQHALAQGPLPMRFHSNMQQILPMTSIRKPVQGVLAVREDGSAILTDERNERYAMAKQDGWLLTRGGVVGMLPAIPTLPDGVAMTMRDATSAQQTTVRRIVNWSSQASRASSISQSLLASRSASKGASQGVSRKNTLPEVYVGTSSDPVGPPPSLVASRNASRRASQEQMQQGVQPPSQQ